MAFNADDRPSFSALQNAFGPSRHVVFFAFDLLTLAGKSVMHEPLAQRSALLAGVYRPSELADLSYAFPADDPARFLRSVREVHGEGFVAKRLDAPYEPGTRTGAWRKHRINIAQEFVIGGYTDSAEPFDAVLVGFYQPHVVKPAKSRQQYPNRPVELLFCASVRNGFVPAARRHCLSECSRS